MKRSVLLASVLLIIVLVLCGCSSPTGGGSVSPTDAAESASPAASEEPAAGASPAASEEPAAGASSAVSEEPAGSPVPTQGAEGTPVPHTVSIPAEFDDVTDEEREKIVSFLTEKLGAEDEATGFTMIYEPIGRFSLNDEDWYLVSLRWLVENDGVPSHTSRLGELALSADMTRLYNAYMLSDTVEIYPGENLLD